MELGRFGVEFYGWAVVVGNCEGYMYEYWRGRLSSLSQCIIKIFSTPRDIADMEVFLVLVGK